MLIISALLIQRTYTKVSLDSENMKDKAVIYKVGGAVRDRLLGQPVKDIDWVVVGASADDMLSQGYQPVGRDFPVFLHPKTGEEYALARTERKSGKGYGGFNFFTDPTVTLEQDLIRRDLTINAMAEDQYGQVYDPYGGQHDIEVRLLRHVSPSFVEDPLRVLRVARFAARYAPLGFVVAEETLVLMMQLSRSGELNHLTAERVWKEVSRALMEKRPDVFLSVLSQCDALSVLMPELINLALVKLLLKKAAMTQQSLNIRWACIIVPLALEGDVTLIQQINQRFKVPNDCSDLAMHVGQYLSFCQQSLTQSPESLLRFLQRMDVLRRPERLTQLLQLYDLVSEVMDDPLSEKKNTFFLRTLAEQIRKVDPNVFIQQGIVGAHLGAQLEKEKLTIISDEQTQFKSMCQDD